MMLMKTLLKAISLPAILLVIYGNASANAIPEKLLPLLQTKEVVASQFAESASNCVNRKDTSHVIFKGCIDWHSAVHGYWSLIAYRAMTGNDKFVAATQAQLSEKNLRSEYEYLNSNESFELPYGRAWLLRLVVEYSRQYSDHRFDKLGKLAAESIISDIKKRGLNLSANDYQNSSWALVNVWDYAQATRNHQLRDSVRRLVREAYEEKALSCSPADDKTGFLPSCLFRFWLVAKVLPPSDARKLINQSFHSQDLPVPVLNPKTPHENGLNFSRAWALWDIYWLTMRPEIIDAYADHVRVGINEKPQWAGSYETVGHWVPQFGMLALQPLFGSAKK